MSNELRKLVAWAEQHPYFSAVSLFLLARLVIVIFSSGEIYRTNEEMLFSTMALERMRGNPLMSQNLFGSFLTGGPWLVSYLYIPLIKLVGCTRMVNKIMALLFSTVGFVGFLAVARNFFPKRTATIFTLLFIFVPPIALMAQTISLCNHQELIAFFGPALFLLFYLLFRPVHKLTHTLLLPFLLFATASLAVFFGYLAVIFFIFICLFMPIVFFRQIKAVGFWSLLTLPATMLGSSVGLLAISTLRASSKHEFFGYYGTRSDVSGVVESMLVNLDVGGIGHLAAFFTQVLPRMFGFRFDVFNYLMYLLTVVCVIYWLALLVHLSVKRFQSRRSRDSSDASPRSFLLGPVVLCVFIMFFILPFSCRSIAGYTKNIALFGEVQLNFRVFYRLSPLFPFLSLIIAATLNRWLSHEKWAKAAKACFIIVIAIGLCAGAQMMGTVTPFNNYGMNYETCDNYGVLTLSILEGIQVHQLSPEQTSTLLRQHLMSLDPTHRKEIQETLEMRGEYSFP